MMTSFLQASLLLLLAFPYMIAISNAMFLPVTKDISTHQYVTTIFHGAPLLPINLVLDLSSPFLWFDCALSSSHRPIRCCSIQCLAAKSHDCGSGSCFSTTKPNCGLSLENPITRTTTKANLVEDIVSVRSEYESESGSGKRMLGLFYCASTLLLNGLASGTKGMLGLGRTKIALPSQLAMAYELDRKFSICLSSSEGAIIFGDGAGAGDIFKSLMYTSLISNQDEGYFIDVKAIKINGKKLSGSSVGETKISTVVPYITMESSIYNTFIKAYIEAALHMNMTRVASVAPFGVCFSSKGIGNTRMGPAVPNIDLVLQSEMVKWRIYGRNSMVQVRDEVMCLGILDGGLRPRNLVVIGGYQLEENLLHFDLGTSMLGFSSSLLVGQSTCSNLINLYSSHKGSL